MLTTIQELEQEIDKFHKNIKDSNELMTILMSVASITKTQTESFDVRTKALQNDLRNLSPELTQLFQRKIEDFVLVVRDEYHSYQTAIAKLMEEYAGKFATVELSLAKLPSTLETQLQKDRVENISNLKQLYEQHTADLVKINEAFAEQLQKMIDSIQAVPEQIKDNSNQQYSIFLKELEKMMDARLAQLSNTEKHVVDLSQQLEVKYDSFVSKLEAANMDQLYKYCQDMNKSINTKLGLTLGGVAIAIILSIVSLFI